MIGMRHPQARAGLPSFALLSVLVLLALACFPVLAHAEESIGPVYDPAVPQVKGHTTSPNDSNPPAKSSTNNEGGATPVGSGDSGPGSGSRNASTNDNPSTPGGTGTEKGKAGNGPPGGKKQGGSQQQVSPQGSQSGPETTADDSSSPLIPILIAIAALAAISIGAVVIRQRRQRRAPGAPVSPKAS